MRTFITRILLIFSGAFGVLFTTAYDLFSPGPAEFGRKQFMGFIVSVFLLLKGLRNTFHSKRRLLDTIMFCIYLIGMFYLVLMPHSYSHNPVSMAHPYFHNPDKGLLEITAFLPGDFGINILGFFPLGYLLLALFPPDEEQCFRRCLVVVLSGLVLSLFIEVAQYYIPGRTSSMNDLVANGIGGVVGALYYLFEARRFGRSHKHLAR